MMEVAGFTQEKTGFPGTLEKWIAPDKSYCIMFILRPDKSLQMFWRVSWPQLYPVSLKSRRDVQVLLNKGEDLPALVIKLF